MTPGLTCTPREKGNFEWRLGNFMLICRPDSYAKLTKFAKQIGSELDELLALAHSPAPATPEAPSATIVLRGETQPKSQGVSAQVRTAAELAAELAKAPAGHICSWDGDEFAVLDIDWHRVEAPVRGEVLATLTMIQPQPAAYWFSRSSGLHLLYQSQDGITAPLWASAAAVDAARRFPTATALEVIRKTRRAGDPVLSHQRPGAALSAWRSVVHGEALDGLEEWLLEHGMEMGGRYDHSRCVIAPDSKSTNPSVCVLPDGIHCHRCGFRGWGGLLAGDEVSGMIWEMAKVWAWQAQVLAILRDQYGTRMTTQVLGDAYRCLLSLLHAPDDPRVDLAMQPTEVYRVAGGNWVSKDLQLLAKEVFRENYFRVFPGFKRRLKTGNKWEEMPDDIETRACYQGTAPIAGIPELHFIRGAKVYGQHLPYPDGDRFYRLQKTSESKYPFQYRQDRPEDLEARLNQVFPGIHLGYLRLCIAARGFAEALTGMPPLIIATGNSGAGKSTIPAIAAAFLDEAAAFVPVIDDEARFSETFGTKSREGSIVVLDEGLKQSKPVVLRERLIALRREYSYRALYVGPVTRKLDNVIVVTGITIPDELLSSEQLGRRAVVVQLPQQVLQWQKSPAVRILDQWRQDPDRALLADWVVSEVIDSFFTEPLDFVSQIAPALGIPTLREYAAAGVGASIAGEVRKFLGLLVSAPATEKGKGWRVIERGGTSALCEAWNQLADGADTVGWGKSEKMQEVALGSMLGLDYPVYLQANRSGNRLYLRFVDSLETRGRGSVKVSDEIWQDVLAKGKNAVRVGAVEPKPNKEEK